MAQHRDTYLMFVDIKDGTQSNKFYNMFPKGNAFTVEYGRMGSSKTTKDYPIARWRSIYNSKVRKGYKDITDLKATVAIKHEDSGNNAFEEFYKVFQRYTRDSVRHTYISEGCSQGQIDEAQHLLDKIAKEKSLDKANEMLKEVYKVIPRRMTDVRDYLLKSLNERDEIIKREQDALDSMDSSNIMHVSNPLKELNVEFSEVTDHKEMENLLYPTMGNYTRTGSRSAKIHKVYRIEDLQRTKEQEEWLNSQSDRTCKLLIHGTRNPNVFSILKSGLLVRPTNAASFAGSVYGDGIYHSAHSAKSLGYVGYDPDKIFLIQNVHMGNAYEYEGWYRAGKDISRSEMNYQSLKKRGCDSLYVKPGDGLLNSEYIVYNKEQSNTHFLVWMK